METAVHTTELDLGKTKDWEQLLAELQAMVGTVVWLNLEPGGGRELTTCKRKTVLPSFRVLGQEDDAVFLLFDFGDGELEICRDQVFAAEILDEGVELAIDGLSLQIYRFLG